MSADSSSLAAVEPSDVGTPLADRSRHGLFRYLTADESADYLAIMDLFSATLLTDLSAAEVAAELAERRGTQSLRIRGQRRDTPGPPACPALMPRSRARTPRSAAPALPVRAGPGAVSKRLPVGRRQPPGQDRTRRRKLRSPIARNTTAKANTTG